MTNQHIVSSLMNQLAGYVPVAYNLDLIEMKLSAAMAKASLNFVGMAAALANGPKIGMAKAQCEMSVASSRQIIETWLSRSQRSVEQLTSLSQDWVKATTHAVEISTLMSSIVGRTAADPRWQDDAKLEELKVAAALTKSQGELASVIGRMPAQVQQGAAITTSIYATITAQLAERVGIAPAVAMRAPVPNTSGFGICTRTPSMVTVLRVAEQNLKAEQAGGNWRQLEDDLRRAMDKTQEDLRKLWKEAEVQPVMGGGRGGMIPTMM